MRLLSSLVLVIAVGVLGGCSRGGTSSSSASSSTTAPVTTATTPTQPPTTAPSSMDAQLQAALAAAGVAPIPSAASDPPELVALGQALFFDKVLSGNQNISCAACHDMGATTADGLPVSMGTGATGQFPSRSLGTGLLIARNAPALFNTGLAGMDVLFWDSRVSLDPATGAFLTPDFLLNGTSPSRPQITAQLGSALAAQALFPLTVPEEMLGQPGSNPIASLTTDEDIWAAIMARLVGTQNGTVGGIGGYRALFAAAFPAVGSFDDFNMGHAAQAIAAFERSAFTALDTGLDNYLAGNVNALTDGQKRGGLLFFGKANCSKCHNGPFLTDQKSHALAVPQLGPGKSGGDDVGRALITGAASDNYKFRTPPLRNVAATGPWMHDGAFTTLEAAVRHHLDPATSIQSYDPTQLPPLYAATLDTDPGRIAARIAAIDPLLGAPLTLTNDEVGDIVSFLGALTDAGKLSVLSSFAPTAVPSGLPVPN
ncbi:MAG TPA: cytochrome c peroxidase [Planctomycetota bacterium]|nr:cytochrome c peroxidase [Planctomycetota bacterium]